MYRRSLTLLAAALFLASANLSSKAQCTSPSSRSNPLASLPSKDSSGNGLADSDPRLLQAYDGSLYVYYTTGNKIVSFKSTDLVNWTQNTQIAFSKSDGSYKYNLYVPGVFKTKVGSTPVYYLFYTQNDTRTVANTKSIGVATSSTPEGPFTDQTPTTLLKAGNDYDPTTGIANDIIDGTVFQDGSDTYLTWKHRRFKRDASGTAYTINDYLTQQPLDATTSPYPYLGFVAGSSSYTVLKLYATDATGPGTGVNYSGAAWEGTDVEHPLIFKGATGIYYLLYNGNAYDTQNYAVGYGTSSTANGTYTRYASNPILAKDAGLGFYGPGSPNTVLDNASPAKRWMLYRYKTTTAVEGTDRRTSIDFLQRDGSGNLSISPTLGTVTSPMPCF